MRSSGTDVLSNTRSYVKTSLSDRAKKSDYARTSPRPSCDRRAYTKGEKQRVYRVLVHEEDGAYGAEVEGLPGCFASGQDLDELREAVVEAITLDLERRPGGPPQATATAHVDEMRVRVSA